jgi:hypothetical protein
VTASATAPAPLAAPEATASATTTASTAESHIEILPPSTVAAPPDGAPTQDPAQQSAPIGGFKSTDGTDVVSAPTESHVENVASVDKNAGLRAENGRSDAQRYEPDNVRTLLFLLAIGLCIMAILVLVAARFRCLDCPHARAAAARAASRRAQWLPRGAWLAAWRRGAGASAFARAACRRARWLPRGAWLAGRLTLRRGAGASASARQ